MNRQRTTVTISLLAVVGAGLAAAVASTLYQPAAALSTTPSAESGAASRLTIPTYPQAAQVGTIQTAAGRETIQLCQAISPASPYAIDGVDGFSGDGCGETHWNARQPIDFNTFGQGEYIGPFRSPHVPQYRVRVGDQLEFVYRLTRVESSEPYRLQVGDTMRVESLTHTELTRDALVQPDGTITVMGLGQVRAARRTVDELRADLEDRYKKLYKVPAITVTPLQVNTRLEDLRAAISGRSGFNGQNRSARVSPDGTIQLPGLGSVPAQGMALDELKREVDERYVQIVDGIEVTPLLVEFSPRFIYVVGEVATPSRYQLQGPTTVMQAIALAGGWNNGGNLREVVVFRRAEDWRLIATKLDIRGALLGKRPSPADEIWLRDSDIVVVPKSSVLLTDDFVDLIFTRGLYRILPISGSVSFSSGSTL